MQLAGPRGFTFLEFLRNHSHAGDEMHDDIFYSTLFSFHELEKVPCSSSPILYIIDYTSRAYLFVSEKIREITDYDAEAFMRAGPELFIQITHKNDFGVFDQKIFPANISMLRSAAPQQASMLMFSHNIRIVSKNGNISKLLIKISYITSPQTGLPLYGIGQITDITSFKTDAVITHLIERTEWVQGSCIKKPLATYYYYPDEEDMVLSKQEKNILNWIAQGYSGKQIADKLHLSDLTVSTHRKNMLKKTNSRNVAQLINFALRSGII